MKHFVPILGLLLLPGISQAQKSNPFKSIGKTAKVQTLSNGKYVETFDDEVLQRVGTVVINRRTKKIVELLDADNVNNESSDNSTASRWYSIDPLAEKFYSQSPYSFAGNNPIYYVDIAGAYQYPASKAKAYADRYPNLTQYLSKNIQADIRKSPIIQNAIVKNSYGGFTKSQLVNEAAEWGNKNSPVITFEEGLFGKTGAVGLTPDGNGFKVDADYAKTLDNILGNSKMSSSDKQAALLKFYETVLHETTHVGDLKDKSPDVDEAGRDAMDAVYHTEPVQIIDENGQRGTIRVEQPDDFSGVTNDLTGPKNIIDRKMRNGQTEVLPTLPK